MTMLNCSSWACAPSLYLKDPHAVWPECVLTTDTLVKHLTESPKCKVVGLLLSNHDLNYCTQNFDKHAESSSGAWLDPGFNPWTWWIYYWFNPCPSGNNWDSSHEHGRCHDNGAMGIWWDIFKGQQWMLNQLTTGFFQCFLSNCWTDCVGIW